MLDGWFRGTGRWSARYNSADSVPPGREDFTVTGFAPAFMYRHRMYDNGEPTDFWIGTTFNSPVVGST